MYPCFISHIVLAFALTQGSRAGFNPSSTSNVAVYWGQNSYGQGTGSLAQQRLSYYCASSNVDIIPLAFVTMINGQGGEPEINL